MELPGSYTHPFTAAEARAAMRLAAAKLPMPTRVATRFGQELAS